MKIIPSLDITNLIDTESLITKIDNHPSIYGYKIGFFLALLYGLPFVVNRLRNLTKKPLIYDHQKACTDIPDTGLLFAEIMDIAKIDKVILFPLSGPVTLQNWILTLQKQNSEIEIIVGGIMTHQNFFVSEGGFVSDMAAVEIYNTAIKMKITNFVIPLTKPDLVKKVFNNCNFSLENHIFYSPGFGYQKGSLTNFESIKNHYIIIGRSLIESENPIEYLNQLQENFSK